MKQLLAGILSFCLLFNSVSPAFAAAVAGIPVGKFVLRLTVGKNTVNKMSSYVLRRGETSLQGFSYATFVERWAYSGYGAEAAARFSTLEKIQLFENRLATKLTPALSKQEVIGFLSEPQKLAEVSKLKYSQQDYFYLNALPEQVIEGEMPLTTDSLNKFLGYNRDVLLLNGYSLEGWARQMGAITNLGLFGGIEDARAILDVAKSTRLEKEITDLIAARALINLDAYQELQELVNFRLEGVDPLGNPAELSYVWRDVGEYLNRKGIEVEIPTDRISILPLGATRDAEEFLAKYNSYNLFNKDSGWQLTENFTELRNNIQEAITQAEVSSHVVENLKTDRLPVRPIGGVAQPLQTRGTTTQGNMYCGLFPFATQGGCSSEMMKKVSLFKRVFSLRKATDKVAEEPGLHDNNVTTVYETLPVPPEAGIGPEMENAVVPVEEKGFKLTLETEGEKILHNVNVFMSPSFKTDGYNRLTISNKEIFQLRDSNLKPENLNRFFVELLTTSSEENSVSKGTLWQLLRGDPGQDLSRPLRIKLQRIKSKRQIAVNLEVELEGGQGVPTVAQVDKNLLPKKANPALGKIIVQENGKIYYSQYGKSPALLHNYSIRLPKGDSKLWALMMQSQPKIPFTIQVRPTKNKMPLLAELLPMNMLGMGKTISPELEARSSFDAATSSSIMFSINNFTPALIGLLRPIVDKYGESTVLRIGSLFFLFGGAVALASGLYGHLGSGLMTSLQLAGFLTSTASIAIGTNIIRFAQNLAIGANVGVVSEQKKQAASGPELPKEAYTWKHLAQRVKAVLLDKQTQPGGAVIWYQVAQMFKNLGTLAFLGLPWIVNTVAREAFGAELGLDFSMSYVPYTALAAWTAWKLSTTTIKDTIPTQLSALERQFNEAMSRATGTLAKKWVAGITPSEKDIAQAVDDINTSLNLLLKAKQRQKIKFDEKEFVKEMKQKSAEHLFERLVQKGVTPEQALEAKNVLQRAFVSMDPHAVTMRTVLKMEGMAAGAIAATLATVHELSVSNGFAFALRNLMPSGDAANALTAFALYGSMSLGRLFGNWLSKRMSGSSLYTLASTCSAVGTGIMIGAGESVPMLISGAVLASFGVGNFFTQMYDFMTKSAHKKYRRAISLILNYTMPAAAVLSMPMRSLVDITGIPALDLSISGGALLLSFAFSYRMFAKSSLIRTFQNEGGKVVSKIKDLFHRNPTPKTPTDLDNAAPAQ